MAAAAIEIVGSKAAAAFGSAIEGFLGASAAAAASSSDGGSGTTTNAPTNFPGRNAGLRRRIVPGQLVEMSSVEMKQIHYLADDILEIEDSSRLDDLERFPEQTVIEDHLGEIFTDIDLDYISDDENYDPNEPLIFPDPEIPRPRRTRRRRFLRKILISSGIGAVPIGTTTVLALLGSNRNSAAGAAIEKGGIDDCPQGDPGVTTGPVGISLNGVDRCNLRRIFTNLLVTLLSIKHRNKQLKDVYFRAMFDQMWGSEQAKNYITR